MKSNVFVASIVVIILLAIQCPDVAAQCEIDYLVQTNFSLETSPPYGAGQSFEACQTGYVERISVISDSLTDVPCILGLQLGTNIFVQGNPQNVILVPGANTIDLDNPLSVISGSTYSFGLFPTSVSLKLFYYNYDAYSQGRRIAYFSGGLSTDPNTDLVFSVEIVPYNPVSNVAGTWGSVKGLYR